MQSPTTMIRMLTSGQPQAMAIGPPLFQPMKKLMNGPERIEMTEKEMAKFENPEKDLGVAIAQLGQLLVVGEFTV